MHQNKQTTHRKENLSKTKQSVVRLDELFITKQEEMQRTKIKLGCLPTSANI